MCFYDRWPVVLNDLTNDFFGVNDSFSNVAKFFGYSKVFKAMVISEFK